MEKTDVILQDILNTVLKIQKTVYEVKDDVTNWLEVRK